MPSHLESLGKRQAAYGCCATFWREICQLTSEQAGGLEPSPTSNLSSDSSLQVGEHGQEMNRSVAPVFGLWALAQLSVRTVCSGVSTPVASSRWWTFSTCWASACIDLFKITRSIELGFSGRGWREKSCTHVGFKGHTVSHGKQST